MIYMERHEQPQPPPPLQQNQSEKTDENGNKSVKSLWSIPMTNRLTTMWFIYTWPIKLLLTLTIPNPKTYRRFYPFTFFMCIVWIGVNSYVIVWMLSVIGEHNCWIFHLWIRTWIYELAFQFYVVCYTIIRIRLHIWDSGSRYGFNIFSRRQLFAGSAVRYSNDSEWWKECRCFKLPRIEQFKYIPIAWPAVVHSKFGAVDNFKCFKSMHTHRHVGHSTNSFIAIFIGFIIIRNTHTVTVPLK